MEVATTPVPMDMTSVTSDTPALRQGEAENIAVCIRVRPLNEREVKHKDAPVLRTVNAMNLISVTDSDGQPLPGKHNVFQYDHIFDPQASTRVMYDRVAQRIVRSTLDGINGTIFAYGQTSSGKTYTMTGTGGSPFEDEEMTVPSSKPESMGILQLAVEDIFNYIEQSTDRDFLLRVSFVEIYNEVIKDLLNPSEKGNNLKLREDPRKGVYVECKEEIITNYENILQLLHMGNQRRTVGTTAMNERSSRSHSIFRIVIESKEKSASRRQSEEDMNGAVLVASLNLVDLAGSESMRNTAAEGMRQREAGNINKSLLTLSRVINSLASSGAGAQNAPFRDSKLTRLLQNSLDGNTRTLIICCVTPSERYIEETKSTLQFAQRAKNIQTSAHVNEVLDDQAQLKRLKREVHELKKMVNSEAYNALKAENEALHNEQSKNKSEIKRLMGLILSSSSIREVSLARKTKPRAKRTRETWCPGDFAADMKPIREFERLAFGPSSSQARKRHSDGDSSANFKENINPQNPMAISREIDEERSHISDRKRRRVMQESNELQTVVQRLENLVRRRRGVAPQDDSTISEDSNVDTDTDVEGRIQSLVSELEVLMNLSSPTDGDLAGENELLQMAVEELKTRLSHANSKLGENEAEALKTLQHEQAARADLQAEVESLRFELSQPSGIHNESSDPTSRLEAAIVEIEELKIAKESTVTKLEDELRRKSDELSQKTAEFAERESELLREIASLKISSVEPEREEESEKTLKKELDAATAACAALTVANQRLENEQASVMDAMVALEEQLQQTAQYQAELESQVKSIDEEKTILAEKFASIKDAHSNLQRELDQLKSTTSTGEAVHVIENSSEVEQLKLALAERDVLIKQLEASEHEARSYKEFLQAEMDEVSESTAVLVADKEELHAENMRLRNQLADLKREVEKALQNQLAIPDELVGEIDQLQEGMEKLKAELNAKKTEEKMWTVQAQKLGQQLEDYTQELAKVKGEKATLTEKVKALDQEKTVWLQRGATSDDLHTEISRMREERWGLASKLEESEGNFLRERRELQRIQAEMREVTESLRDENASLSDKIVEIAEEAQRITSELESVLKKNNELEEQVRSLDELGSNGHHSSGKATSSAIVIALESELEAAKSAQANLVEELSALESQLMATTEEKLSLETSLDRVTAEVEQYKNAVRSAEDKLLGAGNTRVANDEVGGDVEQLVEQLTAEKKRREKLALDVSSYEEAMVLLRDELNMKSDSLRALEISIQEHSSIRDQLEQEAVKLRTQLQRAKEEQEELRYQSQQRLMSTDAKQSGLIETVQSLEQQLAEAKSAVHKSVQEWELRAEQAEDRANALTVELTQERSEKRELMDQISRLESQHRDLFSELEQLSAAKHELGQMEQSLKSREEFWQEREEELSRKASFEMSSLREQLQESQDELEAYQKYADEEIQKLRLSIEQNDTEMLEMNNTTKQREESLLKRIADHEDMVSSLRDEMEHLHVELKTERASAEEIRAQHSERLEAGAALVSQLREDLEEMARRCERAEADQMGSSEQLKEMKSAMEKLEGEAYQHRNELEELSESLKSAQMEAMHYHNQLVEAQLAKEELEKVSETQKKRIEKLEKVKMTTETLELFRKLKSDRQELQLQVKKLEQEMDTLAKSRDQFKEASEQQHARALQLKEEEIGLLKDHVDELGLALKAEKEKAAEIRSEMKSVVDDMMDKAQQEIYDMQAVVKEKSDQVVDLEEKLSALEKEKVAMKEHRTSKESYLEKENLELLVENRKLKKRLESVASSSSSSSYRSRTMLDDDVAAFEASAKAASAVLAEPPSSASYSLGATVSEPKSPVAEEKNVPASTSSAEKPGLGGFLMPSSQEEEEARPSCSQQ
ncbi:hypothetical protein Poli38472_012486 [Pythium oligandrum]|uniref:Kinesin motor domain-containing protein n=1 Tax=Pythium oligandrum TaxID=41045 RepID=A0A8K1CRF3_PYTOL|nr:hypothetical protein Poli38472_012486 [Pythium oligandrum]|eukprot:TMW67370.1 hypothetical protein Poli38472_012486 [Pythium oligandrum]